MCCVVLLFLSECLTLPYIHTCREFSVHVETHTGLFHPDHHVIVVEGGVEEVKYVDTRRFVLGLLEGIMMHGMM